MNSKYRSIMIASLLAAAVGLGTDPNANADVIGGTYRAQFNKVLFVSKTANAADQWGFIVEGKGVIEGLNVPQNDPASDPALLGYRIRVVYSGPTAGLHCYAKALFSMQNGRALEIVGEGRIRNDTVSGGSVPAPLQLTLNLSRLLSCSAEAR